jgi:hypothetical protein
MRVEIIPGEIRNWIPEKEMIVSRPGALILKVSRLTSGCMNSKKKIDRLLSRCVDHKRKMKSSPLRVTELQN